MISLSILGTGNVASHLIKVFQNAENIKINQIYTRTEANLLPYKKLYNTTTDINTLTPSDVFIIAVKDDAITNLIEKINIPNQFIVHTSGSLPLQTIANRNGVFYPLQTFSKHTEVDFTSIPMCLEADTQADYKILEELAHAISDKVFPISSSQRKSLHLSAVFVCNFVNHLYAIGNELCAENNVPFEVLYALMEETTKKASLNAPKKVQTGPAIRHDEETIRQHLSQLNKPIYKEIYTLLTQSIQATNE